MIPRRDIPRPTGKWEINPDTGVPQFVPTEIDNTRRIIDLETRIAALEAALDKLTGEK